MAAFGMGARSASRTELPSTLVATALEVEDVEMTEEQVLGTEAQIEADREFALQLTEEIIAEDNARMAEQEADRELAKQLATGGEVS